MTNGIWINDNEFKKFEDLKLAEEIAVRSIYNGGYWGLIGMLPDPDPVLRKLGQTAIIYKDLLADEEVSAAIARRNMGVKSLDWRIEQGDEATDKEVELCELALKNLQSKNNIKFPKTRAKDLVSQSLNPIYWGYSVFEIVWDKIGKYWLPVKIQEKPREWFYFNESNHLIYKPETIANEVHITGPGAHPMMIHRFIVLQNNPTYENPYGDKALSRCFWPVAFKRGGLRFYMTFVEKYAMPYLVGKQPRGAGETSTNDLLNKLAAMVHDAVAVIPDDSSVDILGEGSSQSSSNIYKDFINAQDKAIQKAILLNSLSMQQHEKGGYSSADAGSEFENDLSFDDRNLTEELFDEIFISVVDLNLGTAKYPQYRAYEESDVKKDLAERDASLKTQGVKFTRPYYKRNYNLQDDEFEVVETTGNQNPFDNKNFSPVEFAEGEGVNKVKADGLKDTLLQSQMEKLLAPVIKLIKEGKDESVLKKSLVKIFPDMNDKDIQQTLAKLIFINGIQARVDEQLNND
jgi:phage gp29-like protein